MDSSSAGARKQGNIALVHLPTRLIDILNIKRSGKVHTDFSESQVIRDSRGGQRRSGWSTKSFSQHLLANHTLEKNILDCLPSLDYPKLAANFS